MKAIYMLLAGVCLLVEGVCAQVEYDRWFSGVELIRLEDGKRLEINTGICAPCFRDMNGDGKIDLLLGEFGEVLHPDGLGADKAHPYVQGRCRVFWNYGTNSAPVYRDFDWLEAAGKPLFVPITCCVGMTPVFADLDGDGKEELLSGCYPGELYCWKSLDGIRFGKPDTLLYTDGTPVRIGEAATVFPFDMDEDGRPDLLLTGLYDGIFWARNAGNGRFEKARAILNPQTGTAFKAGHAVMYDWDGDGKADLLYGTDIGGNVYWCRNEGNMKFVAPSLLLGIAEGTEQNGVIGRELTCHGEKVRLCVYDYNDDGKPDLVIGTLHWENLPEEDSAEALGEVMQEEEMLAALQRQDKAAKKMKRYIDRELSPETTCPEGVPEKVFREWKTASDKVSEILSRRIAEKMLAAGGAAGSFGCVWVYFRK